MFNMTTITAALSVLSKCNQVPVEFQAALRHFRRGVLAVPAWTDRLCKTARELRPPPEYEVLPGVTAAVFDNLTMKINYGSYMHEGGTPITTLIISSSSSPEGPRESPLSPTRWSPRMSSHHRTAALVRC